MIPLNKPLIIKQPDPTFQSGEFLGSYFPSRVSTPVFSARQALNRVYGNLFARRGKLRVYVTPLTCFEALYPIILNGHEIVFGDIHPDTFNLDETKLPEDADVIQALHLGGNPQQMELISQHASAHHQLIIEDCAQAFGASYQQVPVGLWGDYAAFSFMKNLHAIGGGLLLSKTSTDEGSLVSPGSISIQYRKLKRYLESISSFNTPITDWVLTKMIRFKEKASQYDISELSVGTEIEESIRCQLAEMEYLLNIRAANVKFMKANLDPHKFTFQYEFPEAQSSYTRLYLLSNNRPSVEIIHALRKAGIGANHLSQNYLHSYQSSVFDSPDFSRYAAEASLPVYRDLHDRIFCIPVSPGLQKKELEYIAEKVNHL